MESWNAPAALQTLGLACKVRSLQAGGLELLQFGKSAVYRLPEGLVARVSRPGNALETIEAGIRLATWLHGRGFPLAPPADISPVQAGEAIVSFWDWRGPSRAVSAEEMAQLLRDFHRETDHYEGVLPGLDPAAEIATRLWALDRDELLDGNDAETLWAWQRHLELRLASVSSTLGRGPIHGDAQQTNAWAAADGPLLFDFDQVARGPREWDLVAEAVAPRRFARNRSFYEGLLSHYGFPVTTWPGFTDAALAHELLLTLARVRLDAHIHGPQTEAERRMAYWRGDPRPPVWRGF